MSTNLAKSSQKPLLVMIASVVCFGLLIVAGERFTAPFDGATRGAIVQSQQLRFLDGKDGSVIVIDHNTNQVVTTFSGEASFVRTVMRGFTNERVRRGFGAEQPFVLSRRSDNSLVLVDPISDRGIEMDAFGSTNSAQFALLLKNKP